MVEGAAASCGSHSGLMYGVEKWGSGEVARGGGGSVERSRDCAWEVPGILSVRRLGVRSGGGLGEVHGSWFIVRGSLAHGPRIMEPGWVPATGWAVSVSGEGTERVDCGCWESQPGTAGERWLGAPIGGSGPVGGDWEGAAVADTPGRFCW